MEDIGLDGMRDNVRLSWGLPLAQSSRLRCAAQGIAMGH